MIKGVGPNIGGKYKQNFFVPKNPHKYMGDNTRIISRSSWETRFCTWCDLHPNIIKWNSEGVMVPYISPLDNKPHRYYVDFWVLIERDGEKRQYLIEVKPKAQTLPPGKVLMSKVNEGNATAAQLKRYNRELRVYIVNRSKFIAATKYANARGMEFQVCTENFLF